MSLRNGTLPNSLFMPKDHQFILEISKMIVEYLQTYSQRGSEVVDFRQPEELRELIDFSLSEEGTGEDTLLKLIKKILHFSVHTCHPHFYNQLYSGYDPFGIAGCMVSAATNTSMYTYEVAPVYNIMETELVARMNGLMGFKKGDGILSPGGALGNLFALMAARQKSFPEIKHKGLIGLPQLVVFASDQSHYSILKSVSAMGIGMDNLIVVSSDERGKMVVSDLISKVETSKSEGKYPLAVVATSGTTVLGAFDPLTDIADVCEKYKIWLHVDAAWGGSSIFSKKHKHLLDGINRADSILWDAHKLLGVPLQCSFVLLNHKGLLSDCNSAHASYLFQQDKLTYDVPLDNGDKTMQCSRLNDVLKFWIMWKAKGSQHFENHVDNAFDCKAYLAEQIVQREGFELVMEPEYLNVCFYYVPPSLQEKVRNNEWMQQLNKVAPIIKSGMVSEGKLMMSYQPLMEKPNFFRMILSAPAACTQDMDFILDEINHLGKGI